MKYLIGKKMKLYISLILIFLSFLISYVKVSEIKRKKELTEILFKLSETLRQATKLKSKSPYKICEEYLNENYQKELSFNSSEELKSYLNSEFSVIPYISDFTEILTNMSTLSSDELPLACQKLIFITEKGYNECLDTFEMDKKSTYVLFPGIVTILVLILL